MRLSRHTRGHHPERQQGRSALDRDPKRETGWGFLLGVTSWAHRSGFRREFTLLSVRCLLELIHLGHPTLFLNGAFFAPHPIIARDRHPDRKFHKSNISISFGYANISDRHM